MINLTRLYLGGAQPAGRRLALRHRPPSPLRLRRERRPVVVWNITRRCNLSCMHCYSDSCNQNYDGELSFEECKGVIDDLADFGVPPCCSPAASR